MQSRQSAMNDSTIRPRQIIVACDGTNNTLTGYVHDTNVLKIIGQLVPEDQSQILYYDPGVGAPNQLPPLGWLNDLHRRWERFAGLANGKGVYENIAEAYLFLVDTWESGDQIYILGFSRGAFTARCVAGMVNLFGIIKADSKSLILTLIRVYFSTPSGVRGETGWFSDLIAERAEDHKTKNEALAKATGIESPETTEQNIKKYLIGTKARRSTREEVACQVRQQFTSPEGADAAIHFIGVWDTVESVGIPLLQRSITSDAGTLNKPRLRHIRHAISMDEHRLTFAPRLYADDDYKIGDETDPANSRSLRQRWFRGVHSDVGGGYGTNEAGLSDQAYRWMLNEAIGCGLRTEPKRDRPEHSRKPYIAHDPCYSVPWWGVAGLTVRSNVVRRADGNNHALQVLTEGVANEPNPRIYSVWHAGLRMAHWQTWLAYALVVFFFGWYGWLASQAIVSSSDAGFFPTVFQGAIWLDNWQRMYFLGNHIDILAMTEKIDVLKAVKATVVDFGLIAAYSWLLGLYGTWAFQAMVNGRNPSDKIPIFVKLGYAPMFVVVADVVENILTLLTLSRVDQDFSFLYLLIAVAMMLANVVKWLAVIGSLALLVFGIAVTGRKSITQVEGTQAN